MRKIKSLSLQSGVRSYKKFKSIGKFNHITPEIIARYNTLLKPYYDLYIREVSRADMATSLELATFMYTICEINKYTRLLDMGSGLSSFVFRLYAKEHPGVEVFSVDDDVAWLAKTKDYLSKHKLNTDKMLTLEEFLTLKEFGFDCVLHDLNFVEVRIDFVEKILQTTKDHGIIIFDDVHKPDYQYALLRKLKDNRVKAYDLKSITHDKYGRFALAVVKD